MPARTPLDRERAWGYLLDLLTRRDYTEEELRDRLRRRGIVEPDADALLARLAELGLLDDARFAERWVESRRLSRGRLALRAELKRKGVDPELVEEELQPLSDEQQLTAATALLERFAWRYRPAQTQPAGHLPAEAERSAPSGEAERRRSLLKGRARALAFLARRGFTPDVARAAIERLGWWQDEDG